MGLLFLGIMTPIMSQLIRKNTKRDIFLTLKTFWTIHPWYFFSACSYALMMLTRMRLGLFSSLSPSAKLCRRIWMKRRPLQERPSILIFFFKKRTACLLQPCSRKFNNSVTNWRRAHLFSHIRASVAPTLGHSSGWASRSASTISCKVMYFSGSWRYTPLIFWKSHIWAEFFMQELHQWWLKHKTCTRIRILPLYCH